MVTFFRSSALSSEAHYSRCCISIQERDQVPTRKVSLFDNQYTKYCAQVVCWLQKRCVTFHCSAGLHIFFSILCLCWIDIKHSISKSITDLKENNVSLKKCKCLHLFKKNKKLTWMMLMFESTAPFFGAAALTVLLGVTTSAKRDEALNKCCNHKDRALLECVVSSLCSAVHSLSGSA